MKEFMLPLCLLLISCTAKTQTKSSVDMIDSPSEEKVDLSTLQEDLSGKWLITTNTPRGKRENEINLLQEGNTAKASAERGEFTMQIDGDKVKWEQTISTPRGKMNTLSTGRIVNNNRMEGKTELLSGPGKGRVMDWVAVRL